MAIRRKEIRTYIKNAIRNLGDYVTPEEVAEDVAEYVLAYARSEVANHLAETGGLFMVADIEKVLGLKGKI